MKRLVKFIILILFMYILLNVICIAQPPPIPCIIWATAGNNGIISPSGEIELQPGSDQTFQIIPNSGYRVADVKVDDVSKGAITSYTFSSVSSGSFHTIHAEFEPIQIQHPDSVYITATAGEHGKITPFGSIEVPYGSDKNFYITPDSGYRILNVVVDGRSVGSVTQYSFKNTTNDHTIHATFEIIQYTISASAGANGSISPSGAIKANYGANQKFTFTANTGYEISNVVVDGSSVGKISEYEFKNVTSNHTINVVFEPKQYIITATAEEHGKITPSGQIKVNYGATLEFSIIPDPGYYIAELIIDGVKQATITKTYKFANVTSDHTIRVKFLGETFTIIATFGGHGSITPSGEVKLGYNSSQTFTFTPDPGYIILSIYVDGEALSPISDTYTFSNIKSDHSIHVVFAIKTYTITTIASNGGSIDPVGQVKVNHGTDQAFIIVPSTGYHIADVIVDEQSMGSLTQYTFMNVTSDHSINVIFEKNVFVIKAIAGSYGKIVPEGDVKVTYGSSQTFSFIPDIGYNIADLTIDDVSKPVNSTYTFENVSSNHRIEVKFTPKTFYISAIANEHGKITPSGNVEVIYNGSQKFLIEPNKGYHISDVKVDAVSVGAVSEYEFINITSSHTIRANFEINSYVIKATVEGGGKISPSGEIKAYYGAKQKFTITPNEDYHIADVLLDGKSIGPVNEYTFTDIESDHILHVIFGLNSYIINATSTGNGKITPNGEIIADYGSDQSFSFIADAGSRIMDVIIDGRSIGVLNKYTFRNVKANHTIHVVFGSDSYIIKAETGRYGTISPSGDVKVSHGYDQTFIITPVDGYHVSDVFVDGTSIGAVNKYTFENVTSEHTITAVFEINTYKITAVSGEHGTISPQGNVIVKHGESIRFTITPDTGYRVRDVIVDEKSAGAINSYLFAVVSGNHIITVDFIKDNYTIIATTEGSGKIIPSGNVKVEYGSDQKFFIQPSEGYHIANVSVDNKSIGIVSEYTFENVTSNRRIHVTFAINQYTILATASEHLTIKPSGAIKVNHGSGVSFSISAEPGYKIKNIFVDGISMGAINQYAFINVKSDHTIHATTSGIKGDVNGDGKIRSNDAILALRISAGLLEPTEEQLFSADMNSDGKVRANDAILILKESVILAPPSSIDISENILITVNNTTGFSGEKISVPINIDGMDTLLGGDIEIKYDHSLLLPVGISNSHDLLIACNISTPNLIRLSFVANNKPKDNTVIKLDFIVLKDGISPLDVVSAELYNSYVMPIEPICIDGEFRSQKYSHHDNMLLQNYPNPFNPETWIPYQIKEDSKIIIHIYNLSGELIRRLDLGYKKAGSYISKDKSAYWDGKDENGVNVASGIYFYSIDTGKFHDVRKMIVIK